MNLSAFLNPVEKGNKKVIVSNRFVENGKPVEWEIKTITSEQEEIIRKSCTRKEKGKNGIVEREIDNDYFNAKLTAACVVYPDLKTLNCKTIIMPLVRRICSKKCLQVASIGD